MDFVQAPLRHSSEGLGAVSVSGVCLVNPAAQLRAAPAVEPVQHRLADELPIQPDGKVHRLPVFKIPFRHVEEAPLLHPAA
jgi:hypothetical protein